MAGRGGTPPPPPPPAPARPPPAFLGKGAVAAPPHPASGARAAPSRGLLPHARAPLPAAPRIPASEHPSTPDHVSQDHQAKRPPHKKADDRQGNPGRLAHVVEPRHRGHRVLM